jgi:hypothetical protein
VTRDEVNTFAHGCIDHGEVEAAAVAGGIEPPNGGIKISLIIQRFQGAFGRNGQTRFNNLNSLAAVSK